MGKYNWDKLKENLQKGIGDKGNKDFNDPREWKLTKDEDSNGTAVIRLLPGKGGNTPPVVRIYEHSIRIFNKASNKWRYYIAPSPSSIGEPCPVSEIWYELGDIGTDESKKMQESFKRSTKFISNILVVKDPACPENEGKVFYWKYGVKLLEKFQSVLEPTEAQISVGKKPIQLFDPEEGANIILESTKAGGFVNYDGTTIEAPSKVFDTEEEMDEVVLEKCHDLTEFISADYYSPYADLKKRIAWTLEKSPQEAYLIQHGSKVITAPYKKGGSGASSNSNEATPNIGGSYTPKKEIKTEVAKEESQEVTEEVEQEEPQTPTQKKTSEKTKVSTTDDDILDMLNDL